MIWDSVRRFILHVFMPITKLMGKLHSPFTHRLIKARHYRSLLPSLRPGHIFLSRSRGEMTNLFIPGFFSHVSLYAGNEKVIEATGDGVAESDLVDFMMRNDFVAVLAPAFATPEHMDKAVAFARQAVGKPYDYLFESSEESFYCAELVAWSYESALYPYPSPFTYRPTLGVLTVIPQDFWNAKDKIALVKYVGGSLPQSCIEIRNIPNN